MKSIDLIIDPSRLKWINIPDGMELRLCTIPAGATVLSAGAEADGDFHIRYSIDDGEPATVSMAVGGQAP